MKRLWIVMLTITLAVLAPARGGDTAAILGALIGAGAGVALGDEVDDISPLIAAPVLAVAGGMLGHHLIDKPREERRELRRAAAQPAQPATAQRAPVITDRHPGVDLVKISIMNSNGVRTDIPILRIGGKFIGPQGEPYETLPTSKELAAKYGF